MMRGDGGLKGNDARRGRIGHTVLLSLLVSQAVVLGYIESLVPLPVSMPGVKLGLANIISLIGIVLLGIREAIVITILRSVINSLFLGGPMVFLFSLAGGITSVVLMYILYRTFRDVLSIWSISMAGAVAHNIAQLTVAVLIIQDVSVYYYMPVLLVSAAVTGGLTGAVSEVVISSLRRC